MAYKDKKNTIKYNNEFNKQAYDRINLTVPKGQKEVIHVAAERTGESVNGFINRIINAELERMGVNTGGSVLVFPTDKDL